MIKKIENWLEKDMVEYLDRYFTYNCLHRFGHSSRPDSTTEFYQTDLFLNDNLHNYLFRILNRQLTNEMDLVRMYINVQFDNMGGDWHVDTGDGTILTGVYMASESLKEGGTFEINEIEIPFVQNTLIIFDSSMTHRGNAPINVRKPRITLAFKLKELIR